MKEHNKLVVTFLGPAGTYSEEAAQKQFGDHVTYKPEASIDDAIHRVETAQGDIAVVPIENSTEGAVNSTYDHLLETPLQIRGEVLLPVHHQLLTISKTLKDIQEVVAHPQALGQCRMWLEKQLPSAKQISTISNAEAARLASEQDHTAAIASKRAANLYHVPILKENIEDVASNTTRFIALGTTQAEPTGSDKTSLVCSTADKPGALYEVLGVLANAGINMVKLESRLARGSLQDYIFFIDVEGHQNDQVIAKTLENLKDHTIFLKILGSYPKGS
jgi:chorismate mutase / prephenate dehydratase